MVAEPNDRSTNQCFVSLRFMADDLLAAQAEHFHLLERTLYSGLLLHPIWTPLAQLPIYSYSPAGVLDLAEILSLRLFNMPSSPQPLRGGVV